MDEGEDQRDAFEVYECKRMYSIKILATGISVAKTLIKYNSNSLKENDEEEKKPINTELTEQKQILIIMKMLLS